VQHLHQNCTTCETEPVSAVDAATNRSGARNVLVVDDDADLRTVLRAVYERSGFSVATAAEGREAMRLLFGGQFDLVVLDLGLPGLDGLAVLERIREMTDIPVLVLTARGMERDKVGALMAGADDYVTKPFSNGELTARSLAVLRRARRGEHVAEVVDDGRVRMHLEQREAWVDGRQVTLTPTDWSLLLTLVSRPGRVLPVAELLDLVWHDPIGIGPERVKFAVLRLRRRLGWDDQTTSPIQAVRGVGYRYLPVSR